MQYLSLRCVYLCLDLFIIFLEFLINNFDKYKSKYKGFFPQSFPVAFIQRLPDSEYSLESFSNWPCNVIHFARGSHNSIDNLDGSK